MLSVAPWRPDLFDYIKTQYDKWMHQNASIFRLINMDKIRPPNTLRKAVLVGIAREERHWAKIYLSISSFVFLASSAGIVISLKYLTQSFYQSGFYQYLSLIFSENSSVLIYWKELSYSLIETIPIVGTIGFLVALGFFIWSGVNTITNIRRFTLSISK